MISVQHQQCMPSIPDLPGEIPDHVLDELDDLQKITSSIITPPESIEDILKDLMELDDDVLDSLALQVAADLDVLQYSNYDVDTLNKSVEISTNFSGQISNQHQPTALTEAIHPIEDDEATPVNEITAMTAEPNNLPIDPEAWIGEECLTTDSGKTVAQSHQMDSSLKAGTGESFDDSDVVSKVHCKKSCGVDDEGKRTNEEQQRMERAGHNVGSKGKRAQHTEMYKRRLIQSPMTARRQMKCMQPKKKCIVHTGEREHKCKLCTKTFRRKFDLSAHLLNHTSITVNLGNPKTSDSSSNGAKTQMMRRNECSVSQKSFPCKSDLSVHSKLHSDAKPFVCEVCKKSFRRNSNLKQHSAIHSDARPYECSVCKKSFRWKQSLVAHSAIHYGDAMPYKCEICKKTFAWKSLLITHSKTHSDAKPYECGVCKESFRWKYSWVIHSRIHSVRPYQCEICKKSFLWKHKMETHSKNHTDARPYECAVCKKSFLWKQSFVSHSAIHSDAKFECEVCKKSFRWKHRLVTHSLVHSDARPYECKVCKKSYRSIQSLYSHSNIHN